jgi:cell division protein FtsB
LLGSAANSDPDPNPINRPLTPRGHLAAMVSRRRARGILTALGLYIVAGALIGYFGFHAFNGQRGLHARHLIDQQMVELTGELERLKAERNLWERKVALLRPEKIDPDMLDEQARLQLNFAQPNELVFMVKRR